ncbi:MAG TPA: glutamine synthetase type III, partial [Ruminococcaceae bacterium]|nr:glutamine synthetase type III [Oscillospiraceae bacterium]
TGNKFEFRALGSALNIGCPNYMLNTMVAEELSQFYVELKDEEENIDKAVKSLVKNVLSEHKRIIFNGDNYTDEWVEEAKRRGLLNLKSMPEAFSHFLDRKNVELFVKNKIVTQAEYRARYEIELETYCKQINIEALTMIDMAKKKITPAVTAFVRQMTDAALAKKALSADIPTSVEENLVMSLSNKLVCFVNKTSELEEAVMGASEHNHDELEYAKYFREVVFAKMQELRAVGDSMETETASDFWPYPSYYDLLFGV